MTRLRLPALALAATCVALILFAAPRSGPDSLTVPAVAVQTRTGAPHGADIGWSATSPASGIGLPVGGAPLARTQYQGVAGWAAPSHGPRYLAMREPRGTRVLLCGPAACAEMTVNDYGPSSRIRPRRVADIAVGVWEKLAGVPRRYGLFLCSVTILSRPRERAVPVGPETSVE